jgi:hypothetical protein
LNSIFDINLLFNLLPYKVKQNMAEYVSLGLVKLLRKGIDSQAIAKQW